MLKSLSPWLTLTNGQYMNFHPTIYSVSHKPMFIHDLNGFQSTCRMNFFNLLKDLKIYNFDTKKLSILYIAMNLHYLEEI
jgi:hypothetical protein